MKIAFILLALSCIGKTDLEKAKQDLYLFIELSWLVSGFLSCDRMGSNEALMEFGECVKIEPNKF